MLLIGLDRILGTFIKHVVMEAASRFIHHHEKFALNNSCSSCVTIVNPWTPTSDQDNLSLHYRHNIKQKGDKNEKIDLGIIAPIPNFPYLHHKNCMADIKENYLWDLGSEGVNFPRT